jgi:hypothetical protein
MRGTESWTCVKCGETVDAGFLVCWSCGTSIDGVEDPSFVSVQETETGDAESPVIIISDEDPEEPGPDGHSRTCTLCQGPLEPGFIADYQRVQTIHTMMKPSEWVAGTPEPSFWTGTWTGERRYPIQAFRCRRCGHLEFWAGEPADNAM